MKQPHAEPARKLARLERAAVILEHVHDELQAMPPSARIMRLLRANRAAVEGIQEQTAKARTRAEPARPARSQI